MVAFKEPVLMKVLSKMATRRSFLRKKAFLSYRRLYILAVEGRVSEPEYFELFNDTSKTVQIEILKGKDKSAPLKLLTRMNKHLKEKGLSHSDQAWIVIDKDQWKDEHIDILHKWSQTQTNYGLAVSNPKFEYWLLLHFEDGHGISSVRECERRLRKYLPEYEKTIDIRKINTEQINAAVSRAKIRDRPQCIDWPKMLGTTTVYRLVEIILQGSSL